MSVYDYEVLEGEDVGEELYFEKMQESINAGVALMFQGSVGRSMMESIESGSCMLGKNRAADYWGNVIPSRFDVKDGTKGSYGFVANIKGKEYADKMAAL